MTALELLEAAAERIDADDPAINAVVMRWFDQARDTASCSLPGGVFQGVPFLLKDWIATCAGQPLANGNRQMKETARPAPADSVLVSRFRTAGLVLAGRTNGPEFASGVTTEPTAWGATRYPWNLAYSPGGSSGGAAAAVATGMVPVAHATDGSGSIRIPAACCGLVGLKPSQGRISAARSRQATAADHARALSACTGFRRAVCQWWADGYDLLLTPTTGEPPALLGALPGDPAAQSAYTAFTRPFNVTGQPAISLPLSWNSAGLRIGVQFVAAFGREDLLINIAAQVEQARPWASRKPPGETI